MKKIIMLLSGIYLSVGAFAQGEEVAIQKTIEAYIDAVHIRNLSTAKALWKHDPKAFTTFMSPFDYRNIKGFDSIAANWERDWKENPKSEITKPEIKQLDVMVNGNMAAVSYDALVKAADSQPDVFPYVGTVKLHMYETLVKEGDQWKMFSSVTNIPEFTEKKEHALESDLNAVGYGFMALNKLNEAIEVFKLNVQLFPNSHNTYDSLGEIYALKGDKKEAIENYEKALKLYPNSQSAPAALSKLKQK